MTYHAHDDANNRKPRLRLARIIAVLMIIAAVSGLVMYRSTIWTRVTRVLAAAEEDPIPVEALQKVSFQLEVPAYGEIIGLESVPIPTPSTRTGSLKIAWLIPEGSFVKQGDTVVRFDSTDAKLNLEKQENTLEANQERFKITTGNQQTDEKVLGIDKTDAEKEYEYAMTVLPQDETIFSKWDIIEAKINAGFAKERISFLTNKGKVQKRIARSDQQLLVIEKNRAQTEIAITKQTLASLELKVPRDGLLLYRRDRMREPQIGDESWQGQILVELIDLAALQARIYVLERDAGSLGKDKPVVIRLDAIPEKEFHGVVRSVTALAQPLERNSPLKYFTCEVTIHDAGQDLRRIKPGMYLKADVILEKYDSCYVVPASALSTKGVETLVYVKQGEKFVPRPVRIGAETHGQATILSGVEERELIAMRNPFESRKAHLPDFSKAGAPGGGGMRVMFRDH
ncbi:MAG TPA: HlyD family efflux transporter periplasmic adaptor subunit [Acidobacteriota bacterium]|nr:HlyD family efflux transporter periplasmic adaptor subunit [Acidobacteriota bacterium]